MKKHYLSLILLTILTTLTYAQLTPTYADVMIPMRDGSSLAADVYIPAGADSCEVILIQTPYNKNLFKLSLPMGVGLNLNGQPFAWVIVDWRGFYGSNGASLDSVDRGHDAYDICDWIVDQTWHKSKIGTWGPSALGGIQYNLAKEHHPNHTCAVPLVAHPQQSYDSYFYGGVLEEARLNQLDALGYGLSPIVLGNPYYNFLWQYSENTTWYPQEIHIPTLQIGGWYDHNIDKMMDWYEATRTSALTSVRNEQWLLVGPWVHGGNGVAYVGSSIQGELTYPNAAGVSNTMAWDFLQYYLLGTANNWQNTDLITYYELGTNVWLTSNASNITSPNSSILYLDTSNKLSSSLGTLSTSFVSNPNNPAPTIGGANLSDSLDQGPYDQISLESRNDIITFSSSTLNSNASITGRIKLNLYVEANQPDCDIMVHLVDVYPDGRNMLITDGARRMRFRNGYTQSDELLMTTGQVYPVEIELPFTNYTWLTGHKIKIYIGANSSIRWNVNLQDGGTMYQPGSGNIANITIHHNSTYPSSIILPGNDPLLSVIKQEKTDNILVYPNPSNNTIFIQSNQKIKRFEIFNLLGQTEKNIQPLNGNKINISSLVPGVYYIKLYDDDDKEYQTKFIKK